MNISGYLFRKTPKACLMAGVTVISTYHAFSQDTTKTIPDGTEGEVMKVKDSSAKKKKASWNSFNLGFTTLNIGGGFLVDYGGYSQDEEGKRQMDSAKVELKPGFKVRDSRIALSGKLNTKRTFTWKAGFMYDGQLDAWFVRETGIMVAVPELWGHFFVGRTKEGISMSKVMNGYSGEWMERYMASDAIPILADGVKWLGFLPKQRIFWNLGIFTDWLSEGQSFSTYSWQFASRIGWLPVHSGKTNFHIAVNYRIGHPVNDSIRIRSKPEAGGAPYFIDSGKFPSEQSTYLGAEVYYTNGPWMFGSEYFWDRFNSPAKSNPVFTGGELVATYIFTGESRPYTTVSGINTFVPVNKSVFKGGPGAWEGVLRFSTFDLNDGLVKGGKFWRITPQLNWHLSGNVRLELAYGYGILERFKMKGATQFFQSRIQFIL